MGEDKEEGQPYSQEVQAGHGGGHGRRGKEDVCTCEEEGVRSRNREREYRWRLMRKKLKR